MMSDFFVYGLYDPSDLSLHYIGSTMFSPAARLGEHIKETRRLWDDETQSDRTIWIKDILENGQEPLVDVLCICRSNEDAVAMETSLINYYAPRVNLQNRRGNIIKTHKSLGEEEVNITIRVDKELRKRFQQALLNKDAKASPVLKQFIEKYIQEK